MKSSFTTLTPACLAFLLATLCPAHAQRDFTSTDGKKLRAEIVAATETDVTLKRQEDGKEFVIPLDRISEEDQKFVAEWAAEGKLNTRPGRKLTVNRENGATVEMDVPEGEYLSADGVLTLFPGDTVHLQLPDPAEKDEKPRIVGEIKIPERTLTLSMTQTDQITMLKRESRIQMTAAMDCAHRSLGSDRFSRTNIRPTEKGLASFDSWPADVWTLRLSNFELTDRPASEVYQERVAK